VEDDKILLINPPYSKYFNSEHFSPSRPGRKASTIMIPLGLAYIASYLRENSFEPLCIDLEVQKMSTKKLIKIIERKNINYVGITSTSPIIQNAIKIAKEIKLNTNAITILGGVHASAEPIETASLGWFDIVVVGEGEETILEILQGKKLNEINGIVYRNKNKIYVNKPRKPIENLEDIPSPAIDLFPYKSYKPSFHRVLELKYKNKPYFGVITSRGCPFGCNFCSSHIVHGNMVRFRSIKSVIEEVKLLTDKFKIKTLMFYDDTFTFNKQRTIEFCKKLVSEGIDVIWGCNTRVDTVNKEILYWMKKAGCKRVYLGVESGNDKILSLMNKNLTVEKIKRGIKTIKKSGIEISASYIIGAPGETRKTMKQTADFAIKNNTKFAHFYIFTLDPGSRFYNMCKKVGIINSFDWLNYKEMIKKSIFLLQEKISFIELLNFTKNLYAIYYSRKNYLKKQLNEIKNEKERKYYLSLIETYVSSNKSCLTDFRKSGIL
jgi:anaerobic magnesium-protoporphyrin IX monomethyl ester cyclase